MRDTMQYKFINLKGKLLVRFIDAQFPTFLKTVKLM